MSFLLFLNRFTSVPLQLPETCSNNANSSHHLELRLWGFHAFLCVTGRCPFCAVKPTGWHLSPSCPRGAGFCPVLAASGSGGQAPTSQAGQVSWLWCLWAARELGAHGPQSPRKHCSETWGWRRCGQDACKVRLMPAQDWEGIKFLCGTNKGFRCWNVWCPGLCWLKLWTEEPSVFRETLPFPSASLLLGPCLPWCPAPYAAPQASGVSAPLPHTQHPSGPARPAPFSSSTQIIGYCPMS